MKIQIYYFSGTGNTKIVAGEIIKEISNYGHDTHLTSIDVFNKMEQRLNKRMLKGTELIGIGFPVHAFSVPSIVSDFVKKLPFARGQKAFVFCTAGAYTSFNNAGLVKIRQLLKFKGYQVVYERLFVMGSNYASGYDADLLKDLYSAAKDKIHVMVSEMESEVVRKTAFNPVLAGVLSMGQSLEERFGAKRFGSRLEATEACIQCGKCVKACPKSNIIETVEAVEFSNQCMWCMKCVYLCPVDAINPRSMSFAKLKEGYHIEQVLEDESIEGGYFDKTGDKGKKGIQKYLEDIDL